MVDKNEKMDYSLLQVQVPKKTLQAFWSQNQLAKNYLVFFQFDKYYFSWYYKL